MYYSTAQGAQGSQQGVYHPNPNNNYGGAVDPTQYSSTGQGGQRSGQIGMTGGAGQGGQGSYMSGQQSMQSNTRRQSSSNMQPSTNMPVPPQLFNEERRAMEQYNEMRSLADRMNKQVQNIAQSFNLDRFHPNNYNAQQMNPPYNDPVQRQQ